ncbi:MAG: 3-dehydroquinate synthase [Kofleriaceae bacterium]|nr:3-dehydroquinate synthase [Kofleriaceae bacterium]
MREPLFLVGFMAAGKTSIGRAIALSTNRRFVDLDDVIPAQLPPGETVASLVARNEPEFRRCESAALQSLIADAGDAVIATGGGAAAHHDNMTRMRAAGFVVALGVDVGVAKSRAAGGPERPLLASADELAARRAPSYRRAHVTIETTNRTLADVAALVLDAEAAWERLPPARRDATLLALDGGRTYPIAVHDRAVDGDLVGRYLEGASKVALVTDREVARHWQASALAALPANTEVIEIDAGEASKSIEVYGRICEELIARGLDRSSALVALGGGVVGDITGFVAATLFRGIPFVQLPTTIVAMTDAAIGGKTAVDLGAGKNLVGAFWQPRLVACGLETLSTLPARERRAGFGELWKYALLDGAALWQLVDACTGWAAGDARELPPALHEVIARSIAYKAAIVSRDERELTGHRALLNLGHTVGHAIESATGLHHGEAVGLGLIAACRVSAALVGARASLEAEVTEALRRTGLPADLDPHLTDDVLGRLKVDKKRMGDKLRFIAIREVGACVPVEIAVTELRRILRPSSAP